MAPYSLFHLGAVHVSADLIRHADAALAEHAGRPVDVQTDAFSGGFYAGADGLAVGGGGGGVVEGIDAAAAGRRHLLAAPHDVAEAGHQVAVHGAARHAGLRVGRNRHHAEKNNCAC